MDKKTQNLDPQLKATYERVMGTSLSSAPTATSTPAPTPAPIATPKPIATPSLQTLQYNANTKVVAGSTKNSRLSPVLIGVVIVLFFIIYSIAWIMIFKVNLPFIPKLF